ncbi:MAG: 3-phosphoshikimate 1-carboxyvinyltransferase [Alphaproteobacteria bacterium]|nr:3-phosphoshikimate 1-carboxyvinyltransferase [Alphaproteobacteria bacterium]
MQGAKLPMTASPSGALAGLLTGATAIPGDKSISHRALMFGAISVGRTEIHGLLTGDDVLRTAEAFRRMGAEIAPDADGVWHVQGVGLGGLAEPDDVLDMGNSGTAARLLLGLLAGADVTAFMTGDASLRSRPMKRVIAPLSQMGAQFHSRSGARLPLMVRGQAEPIPIVYETPVASAQVKSAVLLAGLTARGATTVIERKATRDHTENLLRHFGAEVSVAPLEEGDGAADGAADGSRVTVTGQPELTAPAAPIQVPGDPSSAAFLLVAASILPGSELTMTAIGLNPTRTGIIDTLLEMGAEITIANRREAGGEPIGDLTVRAAPLKAVEPPAARAPSMIDEYPILAVAAAFAEGVSVFRGVGELRVKESDRLAAVAALLRNNGVTVEDGPDWLAVHGMAGAVPGGGAVETHLDHRIAMSALVLGLAARTPVRIDDGGAIATSFPNFISLMRGLGAEISESEADHG